MRGSGSQIPHHWLVAVDVFNHRQRELELWNDIEYYYVSRLNGEASPQDDYVVDPGVPRTVRAHFQYEF